ELTTQPADGENSVDMQIVGGTFRYNEVAQQSNPVETGTFGPESGNAVADFLFENIPDVTEVTIESQTILVTYDNDIEADLMLRRAQRPVINSVLNEGDVITGEVDGEAEMTLRFTSTEELRFGAFIASLIPEGSEEVYNSREEGENGSELSRFLFTEVTSLEGATIRPDGMTITYRDGGVEQRVVTRVQEALDDYHPRASLQPALWVMTIGPSADTILSIVPIDTGLPLFLFTLAYAVLEIAFFFVFRNSDDKLVRPLVRVAAIFLFFWSLYGHEPLWDYILGIIFPTSAQLVHPNATVIEFTAQHLELVFVSSLITVPAGLLFGILVTRDEFRDVLPLVNNIVNSGQTVPTIAIVAFMAPIIGFGFWPAIIALVAYGLLPVVRNTIAGLEAVPASVIDSARGMGMTPGQILFQIELPIASSVIMAGIRTSMVINVGTATLGAFVGSGGLGTPIASGLSMTIDAFILLGAIPAALLAILIDYVLGRIEFVITPRGLQIEG
ncbi:MAG: ABC transporter permease, partial [Chloroflexota bacterium]